MMMGALSCLSGVSKKVLAYQVIVVVIVGVVVVVVKMAEVISFSGE